MKFVLADSYRYWWPVTVNVPDPETAGAFTEQQLRVQFEPISRDEEVRATEAARELKTSREIEEFESDRFRRIVRDWDGVADAAGEVVPFSDERLEIALRFNWFRIGVRDAYNASVSGQAARLGN